MRIHAVTITGADDATDIEELAALSAEFPFVQWGILASKSQEGGPRFPSRPWIDGLGRLVSERHLRVAMHLCGRWMRELLTGELVWEDLPSIADFAQAFQFNKHGTSVIPSPDRFLRALDARKASRTFIFQWITLSRPLAALAHTEGFWAAGLFDNSGGTGTLPENGWPSPHEIPFPMGFAGGIGPDNVIEQLRKMEQVVGPFYATWIDMEGRVRTDDGARLDLSRVRSVLEQVRSPGFIWDPKLSNWNDV